MAEKLVSGASLTPVDTSWLHMEDPTNLMMVTGIYLFDAPIDYQVVCDTFQTRMVDRFPRFSHKVTRDGSSARWTADRTFSIRSHVHRIALPSPGDEKALRDLVSDLMSVPLDFTKPLWQAHVIEGYGEGSALLLRIHHCIGDGIALVHVLLSAADLTADAPPPTPVRHRSPRQRGMLDRVSFFFRKGASRMVAATRRASGRLVQRSVESILHPSHVMEVAQNVLDGAAILARLVVRPADPVTVFKGRLGVSKRAAWSRPIPVVDVKSVGKAVGGTVNDTLLTAVSGGLRRYLLERGERPPETLEINAMVPVNLRPLSEADKLGNRFGLIYLSLPVGVADPVKRLRIIKKRMDAIKSSAEPVVTFQILGALGLAPLEVADMTVNLFGTKATAVMTNVIGPKEPIYFAGRQVKMAMFWVPQSGRMGMGISIFSYDSNVVVGVATDAGLVPDPERIARAFEDEFRGMQDWASSFTASGGEAGAARATKAGETKPHCMGLTKAGGPCRQPPVEGSFYCERHQPARRRAEKREPRSRGASRPARSR